MCFFVMNLLPRSFFVRSQDVAFACPANEEPLFIQMESGTHVVVEILTTHSSSWIDVGPNKPKPIQLVLGSEIRRDPRLGALDHAFLYV